MASPVRPHSYAAMLSLDLPAHVDEARARLLIATGLFQEGELSVGKAAEIAGLSYRAFLDVLHERGISDCILIEEGWEQELAQIRRIDAAGDGAV